ncbi:MAG: helix-turn-helix transcriptional regulator [Clostridia bacterium]|nr:helix-turn-helix transcriptional regulator [Clostridia bacterium]
MSFSDNLKALRKVQNIDQQALAQSLSVSSKTISHWETAYTEPSINQLIAIADFFDVTLDELVDRK